MKTYLLLGLFLTQIGYTNPEWNLKPKLEQHLSKALGVVSSYHAKKLIKGVVNFVTVGGDSSCDFRVGSSKIQNAINSGASEIRIASNDVYEENIIISNPLISLTLRGGFSSCTAAVANIQSDLQQDWTEITRTSGQTNSVFRLLNLPTDNLTVFENIKITVGDGQGNTSGGAIQIDNTDSDVVLQNMLITNGFNVASGGGISVISSNTTVILNNTTISNNQSIGNGGGIYCNDFSGMARFANIILNTNSKLTSNHANFSGGGAYLSQNCLLSSFAGTANPFPALKNNVDNKELNGILLNQQGITLNHAEGSGGGVYLDSGAGLLIHGTELCNSTGQCFGDMQNPANVMENIANSNGLVPTSLAGGAIYATGVNTDVTISAAWFNANVANQASGGAIALFDHANLTINRNGFDCWDPINCNLFKANRANFTGGFLYNNDATANISHALIQGSNANLGVAVYNTNNGLTNIDTSIFHSNGGSSGYLSNHLFIGNTGADYAFKYTTIADNNTEIGIFKIADDPGTVLLLNSSIIDDVNSGPVLAFGLGGSGFVNGFCVMAHEISSLSGASNTVDDPEFVDRINQDYHLSSTSPAIDYCNSLTTASNKDMDFQGHGWENPSLSNFMGPFDIGADESFPKGYLTIGNDAACDFNSVIQTIQDVIDTGVGEVRIANNGDYDTPMLIDGTGVKLRGGYADCNAADIDNVSARTQIDAAGGIGIPTIEISGISSGSPILIEHLSFSGFATNFSAISAFNAVANITLNDVLVSDYSIDAFNFGGALNLSGGAIDLTLIDTLLINNSANRGGGIYCDGNESTISIQGDSGIAHNIAQDTGGGAFLTNGCELTIYSGVSNPDASTNFGISDNLSYNEGGGIYADLGAQVTLYGHEFCDANGCVGNNTNPVNVNNNISGFASSATNDDRGGGIYATGQDTLINVYAGLFKDNIGRNGGAIYINGFASLLVERLSKECWDAVKCNYFFKNRALGAGTGGALQNDQGILKISSAYFEENDGRTGSVLYAFGSNSLNTFEGTVFNHNNNIGNGDVYVIRAAASSSVEISYSTFADNFIANTSVFGITTDSTLKLFLSIVNEPEGDVLAADPGITDIVCIMAHELNSFTGSIRFLGDPLFVNRTERNYHLSQNSPAIDACNSTSATAQYKDIDFETRGVDNLDINNILGLYDIGADEVFVETIFINGFE